MTLLLGRRRDQGLQKYTTATRPTTTSGGLPRLEGTGARQRPRSKVHA